MSWSCVPACVGVAGAMGEQGRDQAAERIDIVKIGDLDNDGKNDIAFTHSQNRQILVVKNNAAPSSNLLASDFSAFVVLSNGANKPYVLELSDLDVDGRLDIISGGESLVKVFRNISISGTLNTGSFAPRMDLQNFGDCFRGVAKAPVGLSPSFGVRDQFPARIAFLWPPDALRHAGVLGATCRVRPNNLFWLRPAPPQESFADDWLPQAVFPRTVFWRFQRPDCVQAAISVHWLR